MKKKIIVFTFVIFVIITVVLLISESSNEMTPEELSQSFIEYVFIATPETINELYTDDAYSINTEVLEKLSELATEKMIEDLITNRYMDISRRIAKKNDSNITVEDYKITRIQQLNDKTTHFDFEANIIVLSNDTLHTTKYPLLGQIGIVESEDGVKVYAFKMLNTSLLDLEMSK